MKGFTYLLTNGEAYKIGMTTRTVEERLRELNSSTSTYTEIKIVAYCENDDCEVYEKELHIRYENRRIAKNREWFNLSDDEAKEIIEDFNTITTAELHTFKQYHDIEREQVKDDKREAEKAERRFIREEKQEEKRQAKREQDAYHRRAQEYYAEQHKKDFRRSLLGWAVFFGLITVWYYFGLVEFLGNNENMSIVAVIVIAIISIQVGVRNKNKDEHGRRPYE